MQRRSPAARRRFSALFTCGLAAVAGVLAAANGEWGLTAFFVIGAASILVLWRVQEARLSADHPSNEPTSSQITPLRLFGLFGLAVVMIVVVPMARGGEWSDVAAPLALAVIGMMAIVGYRLWTDRRNGGGGPS